MKSLKQIARRAAHAAALIFGAWWLVATGSPDAGPPRDCFTGIANPTRLEVVLGPMKPGGSDVASCGGLDGLMPGLTMVFDLSQGPRPKSRNGCYGYDTDALAGPTGVTISEAPFSAYALTAVGGMFALPGQPACRGDYWSLQLMPETEPEEDRLVSPLDAGSATPWIVERSLGIEQAQFCGGTFTQTGPVGCRDRFVASSIIEKALP